MRRGPGLFLAMAIMCAGLAVIVGGWSRVACVCSAVTCLCAWLKPCPTSRKPAPAPINRDVVRNLLKLGMAETDAAERDIDSLEFDAAKVKFERALRAATPADQAAAYEALKRHGY
ncbi:hypothetical protein JNW91_28840 [Micromonospora sp. STR1_7]|uniref:Uncharacterized protein n=1 Tax=Micromonospora parastrephiae TaxID=2806101 RepID=A0ABS1Y1P9_9ACTN|nr:hypothetical protein [Micromonospora parastrephiae]MBM0235436.1 hypothetical protein [Micromonospora parastrephiae]